MTKIKLFLLLAVTAFLGACNPTDTPPSGNPITVTVTPATVTAMAGDSVTFAVNITDNNTLKDVVVNVSLGGGTATQLASYSLTGKSYSFNQVYHVPTGFTGDIVLTFTVDDASNTNKATGTITVKAANADINSWSQVLVGSYKEANVGSFYSSSDNSVYLSAAAFTNQMAVDMVYFYGSSNKSTLASPDDNSFGTGSGQIDLMGNWTKKNTTTFKTTTLTAANFDAITDAAGVLTADNTGTVTTPSSRATNLTTDMVISFKTANNKVGLVKIGALTGADASTGKGTQYITVKVQK